MQKRMTITATIIIALSDAHMEFYFRNSDSAKTVRFAASVLDPTRTRERNGASGYKRTVDTNIAQAPPHISPANYSADSEGDHHMGVAAPYFGQGVLNAGDQALTLSLYPAHVTPDSQCSVIL